MSMKRATAATLSALLLLATVTACSDEPDAATEVVAATEVTDRATLEAFVRGAKNYLEGVTTVRGIAQLRDVLRSEGQWKSGSLYLITLTGEGNILIHGQDPISENKRVVAVEDELGRPVGQELMAAAERGGDFVEYRWDGTDRVAYSVQYLSGLTGNTLMVVGGFAQDLSSVPAEVAQLPRPEVTAAEVVDRETLKIFVEEATEVYREAMVSPNLRTLAGTKNAFRQEGGDWKSGEIYIYVASSDGYTLFHGAFPVRFEGRQFEDIDRRDVNGVAYIREVLAAGEAGGGYVEYMFDNPEVEGDEEFGSPKVGYASGFRLPGQEQVFVVGSGFYPSE
ncbi:MAG: cache domain-containing protein [bacterium]|nr:cache domain-containing protein [bacterium]